MFGLSVRVVSLSLLLVNRRAAGSTLANSDQVSLPLLAPTLLDFALGRHQVVSGPDRIYGRVNIGGSSAQYDTEASVLRAVVGSRQKSTSEFMTLEMDLDQNNDFYSRISSQDAEPIRGLLKQYVYSDNEWVRYRVRVSEIGLPSMLILLHASLREYKAESSENLSISGVPGQFWTEGGHEEKPVVYMTVGKLQDIIAHSMPDNSFPDMFLVYFNPSMPRDTQSVAADQDRSVNECLSMVLALLNLHKNIKREKYYLPIGVFSSASKFVPLDKLWDLQLFSQAVAWKKDRHELSSLEMHVPLDLEKPAVTDFHIAFGLNPPSKSKNAKKDFDDAQAAILAFIERFRDELPKRRFTMSPAVAPTNVDFVIARSEMCNQVSPISTRIARLSWNLVRRTGSGHLDFVKASVRGKTSDKEFMALDPKRTGLEKLGDIGTSYNQMAYGKHEEWVRYRVLPLPVTEGAQQKPLDTEKKASVLVLYHSSKREYKTESNGNKAKFGAQGNFGEESSTVVYLTQAKLKSVVEGSMGGTPDYMHVYFNPSVLHEDPSVNADVDKPLNECLSMVAAVLAFGASLGNVYYRPVGAFTSATTFVAFEDILGFRNKFEGQENGRSEALHEMKWAGERDSDAALEMTVSDRKMSDLFLVFKKTPVSKKTDMNEAADAIRFLLRSLYAKSNELNNDQA